MVMGPLGTFSRIALFKGLFWRLSSRYFAKESLTNTMELLAVKLQGLELV